MQSRSSLLSGLFKIIDDEKPISDDNLHAIEATLHAIQKLSWMEQHESEVIRQIKRDYPEFPLTFPDDNILNNRNAEGFTLLHCACTFGHFKVVEILLKAKVEINMRAINEEEEEYHQLTPLMLASSFGYTSIMNYSRQSYDMA